MKHPRFVLVALLTIACLLIPARALAQSAATGTVTGRVSNAGTGKYLVSAEVIDKETKRSVYTDDAGSYALVLPEGERVLVINYGGLDSKEVAVTVTTGQVVTTDIALTGADYDADIVKLEKFVVSGEREGRMAAVAQQKAADYMVTIVATDEYSGVTSGNIGDFLRNIAGLDIDYSGDDPRSVSMRGMDSASSMVTMNGVGMASAASGGTGRQFEFDVASLRDVEFIEIFKTPTAAHSASSGGGLINMKSSSAFMLKNRRIDFMAGVNFNSGEPYYPKTATSWGDIYTVRPTMSVAYADSFFRNRLGISVTAGMNDWYRRSYRTTANHRAAFQVSDIFGYLHPLGNSRNDGVLLDSVGYGTNTSFTRRSSVSVTVDYRLTRNWSITGRAQVNTSLIKEGGQGMTIAGAVTDNDTVAMGGAVSGMLPGWTPYDATFITGGNDIRANTLDDAARSKSATRAETGIEVLNKVTNGTLFSLSTEYKQPGGWTLTADAGISRSTNRYGTPNDMRLNNFTAYLRGIDYRMQNSRGSNYPSITQLNGPDIYDLANYVSPANTSNPSTVGGTSRSTYDADKNLILIPGVSTNVTYPRVQMANALRYPVQVSNGRQSNGSDQISTLKADAKRSFVLFNKIPMQFHIGGLFGEQIRKTNNTGRARWVFNGTTDEAVAMLNGVKSTSLKTTVGDYPLIPYVSMPKLNDYFDAHPEKFTEDVVWRTEQEANANKYIRERTYAGYSQLNVKLSRFTMLLGVRYEKFANSGNAPTVDNEATTQRAMEMFMDYVRGYGYADITAAYNDTTVNPMSGLTGRAMVDGYTVTQDQALELTRLRYVRNTVDRTDEDIFPNIQLRYDLTTNILLRASYNKSITRQPFDRLLPGYTVNVNSNTEYDIRMNNPWLKPIYYDNYDFGVDLYTKGGGNFYVGYFYKDVTNYTMDMSADLLPGVDYGYDFSAYATPGSTIRRPENVGGAKHWGIEFQLVQRLNIISESLKDFTFRASYTYMDGKASSAYGSTTTEADRKNLPVWMPVGNLVPNKYMISLNYNSRKFPINITVKYNWSDTKFNGGMAQRGAQYALQYTNAVGRLDIDASWKFLKKYELFVNAQNVTNERSRTYFYNDAYMRNDNLYGAVIFVGIKGKL